MRTTLDLPEELLDEARSILGFKSKTDTIIVALRELIRHQRRQELKSLYGKVSMSIDVAKSRRRAKKAS